MWFLLACSTVTPEAAVDRPKLELTPPRVEMKPVAPDPEPLEVGRVQREGITEPQQASAWDSELTPCGDACLPLKLRVQASTELLKDDVLHSASSASDGDPKTAWCGAQGIGDQLSFAAPRPVDVQRLHFAGWNGSGPAVTEVLVVSDVGDRFVLTLPPPSRTGWPDPAKGSPPVLDLELKGVQFLQFEIRALSKPGKGCVSEVMLEGQNQAR